MRISLSQPSAIRDAKLFKHWFSYVYSSSRCYLLARLLITLTKIHDNASEPNRTKMNRRQTAKHLKFFFLNGINKSHQMTMKNRSEIYCAEYSRYFPSQFFHYYYCCYSPQMGICSVEYFREIINYGCVFLFVSLNLLESKAQCVPNDDDSYHDIDDAIFLSLFQWLRLWTRIYFNIFELMAFCI